MPIGVSIGHMDITAGTLGCLVETAGCHSQSYILSNNHVIANRNNAVYGDPIIQPGAFDGGVYQDAVGGLYMFQPIVFTTSASNTMDAAIAETHWSLTGPATPSDGYGRPRVVHSTPVLNQPVMKYGRTTRMTYGTVTGVNYTVNVDYPTGTARFIKQALITGQNNQPFSQGGDSGSVVVIASGTNVKRPVGLLFASGGNISVASPIGPILDRFGVTVQGDP